MPIFANRLKFRLATHAHKMRFERMTKRKMKPNVTKKLICEMPKSFATPSCNHIFYPSKTPVERYLSPVSHKMVTIFLP